MTQIFVNNVRRKYKALLSEKGLFAFNYVYV